MDRKEFWSRAYLIALGDVHKTLPAQSAAEYADAALDALDAKWEAAPAAAQETAIAAFDAQRETRNQAKPSQRCDFTTSVALGGPLYRCLLGEGHLSEHHLGRPEFFAVPFAVPR